MGWTKPRFTDSWEFYEGSNEVTPVSPVSTRPSSPNQDSHARNHAHDHQIQLSLVVKHFKSRLQIEGQIEGHGSTDVLTFQKPFLTGWLHRRAVCWEALKEVKCSCSIYIYIYLHCTQVVAAFVSSVRANIPHGKRTTFLSQTFTLLSGC